MEKGYFDPAVWAATGRMAAPAFGGFLADATATVNPASEAASSYVARSGTRTANRTLKLGTGGSPVTNSVVEVIDRDQGAYTLTITDDADTSLLVFAASKATPQGAMFYFDGTHYKLLNFFYVQV